MTITHFEGKFDKYYFSHVIQVFKKYFNRLYSILNLNLSAVRQPTFENPVKLLMRMSSSNSGEIFLFVDNEMQVKIDFKTVLLEFLVLVGF